MKSLASYRVGCALASTILCSLVLIALLVVLANFLAPYVDGNTDYPAIMQHQITGLPAAKECNNPQMVSRQELTTLSHESKAS